MTSKKIIVSGLLAVTFCLFLVCGCKRSKPAECQTQQPDKKDYVWNDALTAKIYASDPPGILHTSTGVVHAPELAVQIAELILKSVYGTEMVESQKPLGVNLENGVWIIEGRGDLDRDNLQGGGLHIEIKEKTGEVLKVLSSK